MRIITSLCLAGIVLFLSTRSAAQCQFTVAHINTDDQCLYAEEEVVWKNIVGASATGNSLVKTLVSPNWDAGALSVNTVKNNGWVSAVVTSTNTDRIFGLASSPSTTPSSVRAQFGIYLRSDGNFAVFEGGSPKGNPVGQYGGTIYKPGDVFRILVDKGVVKYYQNSTLLYRSQSTPSLPLTVEATLNTWSPASSIDQVTVSNGSDGRFNATATSPGTGATYQWLVGTTPVGTGTTYTNTALTSADVLTCKLTTGTGGCLATGTVVTSNAVRFRTTDFLGNTLAATRFADYAVLNNSVNFACLTAKEPAVFTGLVNAEASGNSAFKSNGLAGTMDAGVFSVNPVLNNGYVEVTVPQPDKGILIGLSHTDGGTALGTVDFSFLARGDGRLEVYERSSSKSISGSNTYNANAVLKIEVDNNTVKYYLNGTLKYISDTPPTLPLYVDINFSELNYGVSNVMITNNSTGSFTTRATTLGTSPSYHWIVNGSDQGAGASSYTNSSLANGATVACRIDPNLVGCSAVTTSNVTIGTTAFKGTAYIAGTNAAIACTETEEEVTFTDLKNVVVTTNTAEKVIGNNGFWDSGATSLNLVYDGGYAKTTVSQTNTDRMFGLSSNASATTHTSASNTTVQYGIYLSSTATPSWWIYESGTYQGKTGNYSAGDQFKIRVDNGIVRYYQNSGSGDQLIHTSTVPSATTAGRLPLVVDVSLNSYNNPVSAKIENAVVSNGSSGVFQAITTNMGTSPSYQWKLNGSTIPTATSSTFTSSGLAAGDKITCFMTPDIAGCTSYGFTSNLVTISLAGGASSPTTTWTGTSSSLWNNAANWTNGIPKGYTKVIIPSGTPNSPQVNVTAGFYDLSIGNGAQLTVSGSNTLYVYDNLNNLGGFDTGTGTVNFKTCTTNKNTILSTSAETFYNVTIDNPNGVTMASEQHIKSSMSLTRGIVDYSGSGLIVFEDDAAVSGASNASFISGAVKKKGNDMFTFPIGKGTVYRPIAISAPATADDFTAEYIKARARNTYSGPSDPFWTVSGCEYWTLQNSGSSNVTVTLSWSLATGCANPPYITDPSDLRITYWNGSMWKDAGNGGITGDADNGTIKSNLPISNYTAFTLASTTKDNPLPLTLTDFKAEVTSLGVNLLWTTKTEIDAEKTEVQRTDGASEYVTVGALPAAGYSVEDKHYELLDRQPLPGKNYYRLKMIDTNGAVKYSKLVVADITSEDPFFLYPNPVKCGEHVYLKKQVNKLYITDALQRPVCEVIAPTSIDTTEFPPGIYFCYDGTGTGFQRLVVR